MKKRDRLEDITAGRVKAAEERRRLLARKPIPVIPPAVETKATASNVATQQPASKEAASSDYRASRLVTARLPFVDGTTGSLLRPGYGLTLLTNEILDAAEKKDFRTLLLWPGAPNALALAHCTATMHRWSIGDKWGIRSLWYPVLASTAYRMRGIAIARKEFLDLASELAESGREPTKLARSLPEKDSVFLSVAGTDKATLPSLGELIPQFFSTRGISGWAPFGSRYFGGVSKQLGKSRKDANRAIADEIGTESASPDAWFGIGYRETAKGIDEAIRMLCKAERALDVVILCLTMGVRQKNTDWKKVLEEFLVNLHRRFKGAPPGVVLLCDEPISYSSTAAHIEANVRKRIGWPTNVARKGVLWPQDGMDLRPVDWVSGKHPEPRNLGVRVIDRDGGRAVDSVGKLLRKDAVDDTLKGVLEDVQLLFSQLSGMCALRTQLEEWIDQSASRERIASKDHWLAHKKRLVSLIESGSVSALRAELEDLLIVGDDMWARAADGLPMVHHVSEFVKNHLSRTTCSMLLFANERERDLARRFLETIELPNGKRFADVRGRFRLAVPWTFDEDVRQFAPRRMLVVGARRKQMTIVLTRNAIPSETSILMPHASASYLIKALPRVVEMAAFRSLKPRLETLIREIGEGVARFDQIKGTVLDPDQVFTVREHGDGTDQQVRDRTCWHIGLESGRILALGKHSTVFRFEPGGGKSIERAFSPVPPSRLAIGDGVFASSEVLRSALDDTLRANGHAGLDAIRGEDLVDEYKREVSDALEARFPGVSVAERGRTILAEMRKRATSPHELPQAIEYWISRLTKREQPGQMEPPRMAGSESNFRLFAEVLGFDERETRRNWRAVRELRVGHQKAGRTMNTIWEDLILDSTEFLVSKGIPRVEMNHLLQLVVGCVETIISIEPPEES
jgi:hypothetical protein